MTSNRMSQFYQNYTVHIPPKRAVNLSLAEIQNPGGWSRNSAVTVKKCSRVSFRLGLVHWFTDCVGEDERVDV